MGLTSALYTGLSGLNANSLMLSVAGNNISNVNTAAYKRSRVSFETQISQTLSNGSAPSAESGGTNPAQVGLGVRMAAIRRDFTSGALQPTGVSTDMALEGNGFFVVNAGGSTYYTRAGHFGLDRDFNLANPAGALVQGYGVDANFNVVSGVLSKINIPIGVMTLAEATEAVKFAGNLNAGGDAATQGSIIESEQLLSGGVAATGATLLTAIDAPLGGSMFALGDIITITGATRGGATLPNKTFEIGAANTTGSDANGQTLDDLANFLNDVFGIDTATSGGISIVGGVLTIEGNTGTANDLVLGSANFLVNQATSPAVPMSFSKVQSADGESTRTTFVAYDSLGNPVTLDLSIVLEQKDNTGTTWRFYAQSEDDSDLNRHLGTGLMKFGTDGKLISVTGGEIQIDRAGTGAFTPQTINLTFEGENGSVTALTDANSQVSAIFQDGSPLGSLEDFNLSEDGTITGVFSNGLLRTLGRIPVAMFVNNEGLEEVGGSLFRATVNSGIATVVTATTGGAGRMIGRALELSNVELADEFINLISASTGFSASSRVLTTSQQLIQELLAVTR